MKKFIKLELIIFLGLILLGTILRTYKLDVYPAGFHGDEAWTGLEAKRILEQGYIGFWSPSALGQTSLPYYWTAAIFYLLGKSVFTARLSFALLNIFSIPFFYLTVKTIFSRRIAIISTVLFVTSYTSLTLQRRADYVSMGFAFFPSILFFLLALKNNKLIYFIFAGLFIGLLNHIYASYWIIPLIFAIYTLYRIIIGRKEFVRKYGKNLIILAFCYLLIAAPMLIFAVNNPNEFLGRSRSVSIFSQEGIKHAHSYLPNNTNSLGVWIHNVKTYLLMFTTKGDSDIRNNLNPRPVFDILTGIFFLIGLFYCFYRYKKPLVVLIYSLFFFSFISSTFTTDAPNFRRSQTSIYISYIFAAIGITWVYDFLLKILPKYKLLISTILISLLIYGAYYNEKLYFRQSVSSNTKSTFSYQLVKAAEFIKIIPNPYIYFYSQNWSYHYETMRFLLSDTKGEDRSTQFGSYSLINRNPQQNVVYIFLPEYKRSFADVQNLYPNGESEVKKDIDGSTLFFAYIVSHNSLSFRRSF